MTVINFVIALALVAAAWWATVQVLAWSMRNDNPSEDPLGESGKAAVPESRIRASFGPPSGPVNQRSERVLIQKRNAT